MGAHTLTEESFFGLRAKSLRVAVSWVLPEREGERGGETVRTLGYRPGVQRGQRLLRCHLPQDTCSDPLSYAPPGLASCPGLWTESCPPKSMLYPEVMVLRREAMGRYLGLDEVMRMGPS